MRVKTCPVRIKSPEGNEQTDDGVFEALVATYDVDSVGDKIMPGAFTDTLAAWKTKGDPIPVYWSHRMDDPDFNIGHVLEAKETDRGLYVRGQLDMDSSKAARVYRLLKARRVTQFSFAYDVADGGMVEEKDDDGDDPHYELRKLTLYEVGPTPIGANTNTELLGVKSAIPASAGPSGTSDEAWDGPANQANLSNDAGAATYRKAYAWVDPDGDPDAKASYKFIHHNISADGAVGAANIQGCVAGIAVLNGGRGGSNIPDADRQGVYNHLATHIRDSGGEPPELKTLDPDEPDDQEDGGDAKNAAALVTDPHGAPIRVLTEMQYTRLDALAKAGRVLSSKNESDLRDALDDIGNGVERVKGVLAQLDSQSSDDGKATPAQPAAPDETPEVKGDAPARPGPASTRLRTDLAALQAEVSALTESRTDTS